MGWWPNRLNQFSNEPLMPTHHPNSLQQPTKKPNVQLTSRDREVLIGLFEARVFTLKQIAQLYFDDRYEMTKKRLQKLKAAGYVRHRPRPPSQPAALVLAKKGFLAVQHAAELARYPEIPWNRFYKRTQIADSTLKHELAVSDVRVSLLSAIRERTDLELLEFATWPSLICFEARIPSKRDGLTYKKTVTVKPDGFLHLRQHFPDRPPRDLRFYLEVDRGTESQRVLLDKTRAYQDYSNINNAFRVIFIFEGSKRLDHAFNTMAHTLDNSSILSFRLTVSIKSIIQDLCFISQPPAHSWPSSAHP